MNEASNIQRRLNTVQNKMNKCIYLNTPYYKNLEHELDNIARMIDRNKFSIDFNKTTLRYKITERES